MPLHLFFGVELFFKECFESANHVRGSNHITSSFPHRTLHLPHKPVNRVAKIFRKALQLDEFLDPWRYEATIINRRILLTRIQRLGHRYWSFFITYISSPICPWKRECDDTHTNTQHTV